MDLAGEVAIPAPRERVWQALNDPAVLRACIPGCEELVDESPTVRRARVLVKLGPVRARFDGRMTLAEVEAPQRCVLGFEGSGGAAGIASGRSQVELHEEGGATRITYTVKASVGGKLGQIGGRMIDASARQLADQFFAALRGQLAPEVVAGATNTPSSDVIAGSTRNPDGAGTGAAWIPGQARDDIHGDRVDILSPVAPLAAPPIATEAHRILWFLLGAASTGFGVWLGRVLF